jgi:ParB family chromosome partitioning protein
LRTGRSKPSTKQLTAYPELEEKLRKRLGTKVTISRGRKGGCIEIHYYEPADLDRLADMILG